MTPRRAAGPACNGSNGLKALIFWESLGVATSPVFERHQRKAAVLFAVADVLLTICAFEAAYQTVSRFLSSAFSSSSRPPKPFSLASPCCCG